MNLGEGRSRMALEVLDLLLTPQMNMLPLCIEVVCRKCTAWRKERLVAVFDEAIACLYDEQTDSKLVAYC